VSVAVIRGYHDGQYRQKCALTENARVGIGLFPVGKKLLNYLLDRYVPYRYTYPMTRQKKGTGGSMKKTWVDRNAMEKDSYAPTHRHHMNHELERQDNEWHATNRRDPYATWDTWVLWACWIVGVVGVLCAMVVLIHQINLLAAAHRIVRP
jgi:hypothetical protein